MHSITHPPKRCWLGLMLLLLTMGAPARAAFELQGQTYYEVTLTMENPRDSHTLYNVFDFRLRQDDWDFSHGYYVYLVSMDGFLLGHRAMVQDRIGTTDVWHAPFRSEDNPAATAFGAESVEANLDFLNETGAEVKLIILSYAGIPADLLPEIFYMVGARQDPRIPGLTYWNSDKQPALSDAHVVPEPETIGYLALLGFLVLGARPWRRSAAVS